MANKLLLEKLFAAHQNDLQDVIPEIGTAVLCPICLNEFEQTALYDGQLTDGHVWPREIRERTNSELATSQRVLLCKECNSKAGSRGDAQMQILQRVRDSEKTGQLYGERRVELLIRGEEPKKLRSKIIRTGEKNARFVWDVDPVTRSWRRNNPEVQKRFEALGSEDRFSVVVHPPHDLVSHLAMTGWVTSAYLLAFYRLGYRYLLNPWLDPVRDYIKSSFEESAKEHLAFPESDVFSAGICKEHCYDDPILELMVPFDGETPMHLQVSFLDYHVRLPFPCDDQALIALLNLELANVETVFQEAAGQDVYLSTPIVCTKTNQHDCVWDYVLGKQIPNNEP